MRFASMVVALALLVTSAPAAARPGGKGKTGTISGVVAFKGEAPPRSNLDRSVDAVCARTAQRAEEVVVEDGTLRDVFVRIKAGTAGKHAPPKTPVVVAQDACMYRPRVVGLVHGQALHVGNGDPTFHNVRGVAGTHTLFNIAHPPGGAEIVRDTAGAPGDVLTLRCDVHPWMRGYVVVSDHPFFSVTQPGGRFRITDVPAGRYTLEAWHAELGLRTTTVVVRAGKEIATRFEYGK